MKFGMMIGAVARLMHFFSFFLNFAKDNFKRDNCNLVSF